MIYISLFLILLITGLIIYAAVVLGKTSKIFNLIQDHQAVQNDINNGIIERLKAVEAVINEIKR